MQQRPAALSQSAMRFDTPADTMGPKPAMFQATAGA